jgi:hypothetical protein
MGVVNSFGRLAVSCSAAFSSSSVLPDGGSVSASVVLENENRRCSLDLPVGVRGDPFGDVSVFLLHGETLCTV